MTRQQLEALKLFPNGYLLSSPKYGKVFSELAEQGLVRFNGLKNGRRSYRLTDIGLRVILEDADGDVSLAIPIPHGYDP